MEDHGVEEIIGVAHHVAFNLAAVLAVIVLVVDSVHRLIVVILNPTVNYDSFLLLMVLFAPSIEFARPLCQPLIRRFQGW